MKNKIFNAIQKGLMNALVFDDNDSSISYQKSNIDNEAEFPKVSLDALYNIFKSYPEDIFRYNTKNCLTLILDNGKEISLYEYKKVKNKPVFLKIFDDILKNGNNEIIIACNNNHYISPAILQWQTEHEQILHDNLLISNAENTNNDFNGYQTCQTIINSINKQNLSNIPAINYCNDIKAPLPFYKGYLPSIGQLNFILKYLNIINFIFKYIGFDILNLSEGKWWSSSENSHYSAWGLNYGDTYIINKYYSYSILPIFALKNN